MLYNGFVAFLWLTKIWKINLWVSRRCVRKTYCQDDIWSGWPAALGHLSGVCLPGQIVARPTPVYTRIFSYYFSSNLFVVRLAKKVKYGIRKGFCRPSHPYFDKMCFFSEIEKCLRRTAVYKESVIFYGFNFSPAFCVPISENKEWGGPFNILLSGGDTSIR